MLMIIELISIANYSDVESEIYFYDIIDVNTTAFDVFFSFESGAAVVFASFLCCFSFLKFGFTKPK
eukprot:UN12961